MTDPIQAANQINHIAANSKSEKLAFALGTISVVLLGTMLLKDFLALGKEIKHDCFGSDRGRSR